MKMVRMIIISILSILMASTIVYANVSGNSTAFCVGTIYTDINTTADAQNAGAYYTNMGISSVNINTVPTKTNMNGSHSGGQKYLASGIVFLSGHGNSTGMDWNFNGYGGTYYVGVRKQNYNQLTSAPYLYGIGSFTLSDIALYVFAGCKTAEGSSNIAKYAVDNGAKISIGWTKEVIASSHSNWLNRFNYYLSLNYSVASACSYADSFTYLPLSNVSYYNKYGWYNHNPYGIIQSSIPLASFNPEKDDRYLGTIDCNGEKTDEIIDLYIANKYGNEMLKYFYVESVENDGTTTYDYTLCVEQIHSLIGITFMEKDGTLSIYDNTEGVSVHQTVNQMKEYYENNKLSIEGWFAKAIEKNVTDNMFDMKTYIYYNHKENKYYVAFSYVAIDEYGYYYADCILNPIE